MYIILHRSKLNVSTKSRQTFFGDVSQMYANVQNIFSTISPILILKVFSECQHFYKEM